MSMPSIPSLASKSAGLLTLCIILLVIGRELNLSGTIETLLFAPVTLLVLLLSFFVSRSRQTFVIVAALLTLANLVLNDDWRTTLTAGFSTAAFIAAFFSSLTTLKFVAETSPAIRRCGHFLSHQAPGRRYLALTVGGQLFGLLLNYGSISLLGGMSMANAALERDVEIRNHRIRRMLLAIQRGFISILPWSPFSFAIAISTALVPGASWAQCALPGLVSGAILAGVGWLLDTLFKPRISSELPPRQPVEGNWFTVMPLVFLLVLLMVLIGGVYLLTGVRILVLVMVIVPLLSMAWIMVQTTNDRPLQQLRNRSVDYVMVKLASFRGEMVLLMMAGYLGTVASPIIALFLQSLNIDLATLPAWVILVFIIWFIPIVGQLGMNPILAAAIVAPLLPDPGVLGVSSASVVLAITAGWILSGISSPFTVTTLLVGNFAGVSSAHVGQRWNGFFTILCAIILSIWVVIYASYS